jgi:hypothetical protein
VLAVLTLTSDAYRLCHPPGPATNASDKPKLFRGVREEPEPAHPVHLTDQRGPAITIDAMGIFLCTATATIKVAMITGPSRYTTSTRYMIQLIPRLDASTIGMPRYREGLFGRITDILSVYPKVCFLCFLLEQESATVIHDHHPLRSLPTDVPKKVLDSTPRAIKLSLADRRSYRVLLGMSLVVTFSLQSTHSYTMGRRYKADGTFGFSWG